MDLTPNGTQPRMDLTPNGTQHRMDLTPNGTQPRMDSSPNGTRHKMDLTLNGPQPRRGPDAKKSRKQNRIEREEQLQQLVSNFFNLELNSYVEALITFFD